MVGGGKNVDASFFVSHVREELLLEGMWDLPVSLLCMTDTRPNLLDKPGVVAAVVVVFVAVVLLLLLREIVQFFLSLIPPYLSLQLI